VPFSRRPSDGRGYFFVLFIRVQGKNRFVHGDAINREAGGQGEFSVGLAARRDEFLMSLHTRPVQISSSALDQSNDPAMRLHLSALYTGIVYIPSACMPPWRFHRPCNQPLRKTTTLHKPTLPSFTVTFNFIRAWLPSKPTLPHPTSSALARV